MQKLLITLKNVPPISNNDFFRDPNCSISVNEEEQEHAPRICILFQLHRAIDTSHVQGNYIPLYRRDPAYSRKDVIGRPNNTRE